MASMPNMKLDSAKDTRTPRDRFGLRGFQPNNNNSSISETKNGVKSHLLGPKRISEDDVEAENDTLLDAFDFDDDDDDEEDNVTSFIRPGVIRNKGENNPSTLLTNNKTGTKDGVLRDSMAQNGRAQMSSASAAASKSTTNNPQQASASRTVPTTASSAARATPSFRTFAAKPKNGYSHNNRRPILQLMDSTESASNQNCPSSPSNINGLANKSPAPKRPSTLDYCSKNGRRHHQQQQQASNGSRISYDALSRMNASTTVGPSSASRHYPPSHHCRHLIAPSDNDDEVEIDTLRLHHSTSDGVDLGDEEPLTAHFGPIYTKENLIKNLALLSVACTLLSSGFHLFPALNSSLYSPDVSPSSSGHSEANLYAPAVLFACATVATLFSAPMVTDTKLRPKWGLFMAAMAIAMGSALRAPKTTAMSPPVVLISSAVQGLFWGLAQNACLVSLLNVASKLSCMDRRCPERVHLKIAVLFHLCVATFWVWGNGLTSTLLSAFDLNDTSSNNGGGGGDSGSGVELHGVNSAVRSARGVRANMGPPILFATTTNNNNFSASSPKISSIIKDDEVTFTSLELGPPWTPISGTAVTLTLIGGLAAAAMDDLKRAIVQDPLERNALAKHVAGLRAALNNPTTLLSIPLSFFVGFETSVLLADFNYTFVTLRMGTKYIGFVLVAYGFAFLVGSYIIGILKRPARRLAFLWAATAFFAGVLLTARLMTSSKMADDPPLFYVLAAVWGLCSGVWDTLIKTFLHATNGQNLHTHTVHLSTVSFGLTLGFALYPAFCLQAKLWVLAALMIPAVVCQAWAEITFARQTDHDASVAAL